MIRRSGVSLEPWLGIGPQIFLKIARIVCICSFEVGQSQPLLDIDVLDAACGERFATFWSRNEPTRKAVEVVNDL
jgi:hypothetical protein